MKIHAMCALCMHARTHTCTHAQTHCSGAWGPWSQPPACGKGSCKRKFALKTPQNECGKKCADEGNSETQTCGEYPEQQDCVEIWGPWTACSAKCNGKRTRRMKIKTQPSNCPKSKDCSSKQTDEEKCNGDCTAAPACDPVPCETKWNPWSECSEECGQGKRVATVKIVKQAECGGKCSTEPKRESCGETPRKCDWKWEKSWSACKYPDAEQCKPGTKERKIIINQQPNTCGKKAGGECPSGSAAKQEQTCEPKRKIECDWAWSTWSDPPLCGKGTCKRTRKIKSQPQCAPDCPKGNEESQSCQGKHDDKQDCIETWGPWTDCSSSCKENKGKQTRSMKVKTAASDCPQSKKCTGGTDDRARACMQSHRTHMPMAYDCFHASAHARHAYHTLFQICYGEKPCEKEKTPSPEKPGSCNTMTPLLGGQCCDKLRKVIRSGKQMMYVQLHH